MITPNAPLFQVESLACAAGYRPLFMQLGLSLERGQWIELTGPNGTGKSTLLRALAGLIRPLEGALRWHGKPVSPTSASWRANLVYDGHAPAIKDNLTCAQNLSLWLTLDHGKRPAVSQLDEALELAGIRACASLPAASLSAGQRRRVQLARLSQSSDRPLWLLDEPGNALDKAGLVLLDQLISQHLIGGGCAIIATHQPLSPGSPAIGLSMPDFAPSTPSSQAGPDG